MFRSIEVVKFVKAALQCSVYVSPRDPGLTHDELMEAARRLDFQQGEVADALRAAAAPMHIGDRRYMPQVDSLWGDFIFVTEPDYRNVYAFDFVFVQLQELARSIGQARAQIAHEVLVERGAQEGLERHDLEVAIKILLLVGRLETKDGALRFARGQHGYATPSAQLKALHERPRPDELLARVYPVVRDVVSRRTDGRLAVAEPLDAFATVLDSLGHGPFRLWWRQTVSELRLLDSSITPVAVAVLSAALVEGSLTFVVRRARELGVAVFKSSDFAKDPRTWKIDDLVASASSGNEHAILDQGARHRADALIKVRQRIHAGRMLSEYPGGVPDLRPEEAREAKATVELVVRKILDWLERHPATT